MGQRVWEEMLGNNSTRKILASHEDWNAINKRRVHCSNFMAYQFVLPGHFTSFQYLLSSSPSLFHFEHSWQTG